MKGGKGSVWIKFSLLIFGRTKTVQSIKSHLEGTAERAKKFGDSFGGGEYAYLCGMLHDIGKYSEKFQKRIYEGGNFVDHSTAGAVTIHDHLQTIGFLLAYCIAGHHAGLPDGGSPIDTSDEPTLNGRLKRKTEPFTEFQNEIELDTLVPKTMIPIHPLGENGFSVSFYIRMLYSCLVDGDYLDTEEFMSDGTKRGGYQGMEALSEKLDKYITAFDSPTNRINKKRTEILYNCKKRSGGEKGLYTMTVPTGGGKTISSLVFALGHAKKHKMDREIYVIPYNSIIEQNAAVFKKIVGEEAVLEHHSNFAYDDTNELGGMQRLAAENWDMPIIVTTTVQFFESIFSNRPSHCRKLHSMANSVIVFDEAQMLPTPYLLPCVRAISELVYNYASTVVLCSATQPTLGGLFPKELVCKELCGNTDELFEFFRRAKLLSIGELQDDGLARRLNSENQVLCIVNARKQAQTVFKLLQDEGSYHLSTFMYPPSYKLFDAVSVERVDPSVPARKYSDYKIHVGPKNLPDGVSCMHRI